MLLAPQHFQQQDRRYEALLHFHLGLDIPFHWGVSQLQYDWVFQSSTFTQPSLLRGLYFCGALPPAGAQGLPRERTGQPECRGRAHQPAGRLTLR
ncbi:hypothetical protein DAT35_17795 [Vitiosangium sp. GDMCC 1.1324]|nr:hypothetical protein DAT35_17795 [Vitiosangium sp. GDMCC 1.1324]